MSAFSGVAAAGLIVSLSVTPPATQCLGDCNGDGRVTVDEVTRSIGFLLRVEPPDRVCPAADGDGDGAVSVTELIVAVDNALTGCSD